MSHTGSSPVCLQMVAGTILVACVEANVQHVPLCMTRTSRHDHGPAISANHLAAKTCWGMSILESNNGQRPSPAPQSHDDPAAGKEDYQIKRNDAHNLQRPETVESLFVMWRVTKDSLYREWGRSIFKAIQNHTRLRNGCRYTSLDNVNHVPPELRDNTEIFVAGKSGFWTIYLNDKR